MTRPQTLTCALTGRFTAVRAESGDGLPPWVAEWLAEAAVAVVVEWLRAAAGLNRELTLECLCPRDHDRAAASLEETARLIEHVR